MGKSLRRRLRSTQSSLFLRSEIEQMEKLLLDKKDELLDESFYQKLMEEFNLSSDRAGYGSIQMKEVQTWFERKRKSQANEMTSSHSASKDTAASDTSLSNDASESSYLPKDTEEKAPDINELEFEAKSSKDEAWYDVDMFLAHRVLSSGELEVRVRYRGFGSEEDEWVNVKKDVRERSIPLESSECRKVAVGDLVLCFKESSEQAIHFDAHIIGIERKLHDMRGCRCLFLVRYDHDLTEEKVNLGRLSRRPDY